MSGAKPPRFTRESVEQAVESLRERIGQVNKDQRATFRITDAVAFGDFLLSDRPRVQAALTKQTDISDSITKTGQVGWGSKSR